MNTKGIFGVQPKLPYAVEEAINRLRINVSFLGSDVRRIMIVSSEPNEGKSFIAMNLWRQMAMAGERSILIDADMRKSVMIENHKIKRADNKEIWGLSHYLSDNKKLEDCILSTEVQNGDILPNSSNIVNPSMLLDSSRFSELMEMLGKEYRYVFLDVPPLELVSDGERIGNLCDGAIMVVRSGVTGERAVKDSISQLERAGCPLLGVVLNRVDEGKKKYYKGYYGKHKGYYGSSYYAE